MEYYHYDINKLAEKCTIPKNLIFYIAYRNLLSYKETNEKKYLKYPQEYYTYIWGNNAYYWPCHINISGYGDNLHWESFKKDYMHITTKLEDVIKPDIVLPFKLLKPGHVERVLKDTYQRCLASYDQDKAKYYELLRNKIAYFSHTPSIHVIAGEPGYAGYLGFVYENDYLVFEKFYNTTKNPNILNPLTHEEAIYSYPADCLDLFGKDKQYILNEMKTDWRIRRVFHTSDNAFMTKVDEIIALPNHSLTSFDEEIENYKEKILVLR